MTLQELLTALRARGVAIRVDAGELSVRAPRGALSTEMIAELKARKPELIALGEASDGVVVDPGQTVHRITPEMLPLVTLTQPEIDAITADLPGGVSNLQDIYPLAPLQEGILFHHLIESADESGGDTYLQRSLVVFPRREQLDAFLGAMQRVIDRHDILRSAVRWQGLVQPVQVVYRRASLPVQEVALDDASPAMAQLRALTDPRRIRIDLSRAPLLAAHVARDPHSGEWLLAMLNHHMVCDHVTMDLLLAEIQAITSGREAELPAPLSYRNFIAGMRAVPQAEHEAFFRAQLGHIDEPTAPFGVLDVTSLGQSIEDTRIELDDALARRIRAIAQRHGASPAVLFHLAWSQVLARCCGRDDVVFGTVLSGRLQSGANAGRVVGMFINTLPFAMSLAGKGAADAFADARTRLIALLAHEHAPLALAQRCSGVAAPAPLFTTLLNYRHSGEAQDAQGADDHATDVFAGVRFHGGEDRTNYPLTLSVNDRGEGFGLGALAVAGIDGMRMMRYLETTVIALVDALEKTPERPVRSLPLLPASERAQVLTGFGAALGAYDRGDSLHGLFAERAAQQPDAVALRFDGASLTYGELDRRANRLAHRLVALGVRTDDRVAICAERGFEMLVGVLAILKAGGGYVPLDPVYPADRLQYMLADSAPVAVLAHGDLPERIAVLSEAGAPLVRIDDASLASEADTVPAVEVLASHLAYVIYTSGSTGQPKGVMVEHGHVTRLFTATDRWFGFGDGDVWTLFHSFAFDFSVWEIWGALLYGGRLVIVPELVARSPSEFYGLLSEEGVTVLNQTPSAFRALIPGQSDAPHRLRAVIFGGEALELHTLAPWVARNDAETTQLINMYGITEITVHATYRRITAADIEQARGSVIGCAIPDLRLYVLDADREPVPVGVIGELYVSGAGVTRGYLNREALTSERFVADPFSEVPGARMYKAGDLARWLPDGDLEYLGRNDFQVKIRGFRIELGEIEAKLGMCEGVREAVVIAREDASGDKRLVAYVVSDVEVSAGALRARLSQELAEYMIPSAFVQLSSLPLTANGKLDRRALPAPDAAAVAVREYEAPVGDVEVRIAEVWCELLKLDRVGRRDHFFELGGHSLLVIGMIERLRQQGLDIDVRSVFANPTLDALALRIAGSTAVPAIEVPPNLIATDTAAITPELLPLVTLSQDEIDGIVARVPGGVSNIQDIYPLAPLQEGILFHHLLEADHEGDTYLLRSMVEFDTRQRLDTFVDALQTVIARHDILRSAVFWQGLSRPIQVVHRHAPLPVHELTLSPDDRAEAQLLARTDTRTLRLDLNRAPVLAAYVAHDAENDRWLLAVLTHHIVEDNYSKQLMLKEAGLILGGRTDLLPAPVPYRNFIAHLGADSDDAHEAYFREVMGDVDEPTAPFGALDIQFDGGQSDESRIEFEPALAARIREAARRAGVTASTLFHLAWAHVLGRCSGRDDVVFGTVLSGRLGGSEGADRVVGMFLNTLPLRLKLGVGSAAEAVRDAYVRMGALLEHEQASLALAQRCSAIEPSLPLFTALMNYRNRRERERHDADTTTVWEGMRLLSGDARNNYPLTMSVEDRGEGFGLTLLSAPGIDGARVVGYMQTAMIALVDALEAGATTPLSLLSILPSAERAQVLHGFQDLRVDAVHDRTVHAVFEARVRAHPDAEAVRYGDEVLTYAELNARANRVAHRLIALGVRPDDRVAICADRGVAMLVAIVGVWKSGGGYVPLDPSYPLERLAYMLSDSGPKAVVTTAAELGSLPMLSEAGVPVVMADDGLLDASAANPQVEGLGPRSLAYVIYTSGSTGQPKGVMVEHRSPVNFWRVMEQTTHAELKPQSRVGLNAAFSFDMSLKGILQLLSGHCVVPVPQSIRASGAEMVAFMERERIDAQDSTPSQLQVLLDAGLLAGGGHRPTSIYLGGEPVGLKLWETLKSSERIHFHNMYGPTECTVDATIESIRHSIGGPVIGKPIMNVPVYVLDATLEPVPVGVPGELYLGGVQVARGYLDREELTQERFVRDPFSSEADARMYRTGDLGRWRSDGRLEYLGRNDFQVKIRGFRIELGEIESRLSKLAGVREAVVLAREDVEGDQRLVAYVVPAEGATLEVAALREGLSKDLAEYMIPSAFVVLERLPLTPNGKLDRKALPAPDGSAVASRAYEAPVGEVEEAIAAIWGELLNLERVGRNDHFFELGGHSLLVMQLVVRMRERFDVELPLRELFEKPLLSAVADAIRATQLATFMGDELEDMQDELDGLSEEELQKLLEQESVDG